MSTGRAPQAIRTSSPRAPSPLPSSWYRLPRQAAPSDCLGTRFTIELELGLRDLLRDAFLLQWRSSARARFEGCAEQFAFVDGCPNDWNALPPAEGPITVGIDGGYPWRRLWNQSPAALTPYTA